MSIIPGRGEFIIRAFVRCFMGEGRWDIMVNSTGELEDLLPRVPIVLYSGLLLDLELMVFVLGRSPRGDPTKLIVPP